MGTLRFTQFSGEIPRVIPRLLPEMGAQLAKNVRLDDGALTPVRRSKFVEDVANDTQTIYLHGDDWLAFDGFVNVAHAPVDNDRVYYTGDGAPKMRLADGTIYDVAVPYPTAALSVALSGTPDTSVAGQDTYYAYTFVSNLGEESEPCALGSSVTLYPGHTATLSGFQAIPSGSRITKQRIYRSQYYGGSGADLYLIAERSASTSNYADVYDADEFMEVIPSKDWNQPPSGLSGLISAHNGIMVGFVGKKLYFCEPYRPHAWPEKYILTMDYNIVAVACFVNTIVVMTDGQPYVVSGSAPENMQQERIEETLPCINALGVVEMGYAVCYPSPDGLVMVGISGASIITKNTITKTGWLRFSPETMIAGKYGSRYFASYSYINENAVGVSGTLIFDVSGETPFILQADKKTDAMFTDIKSGKLYMLVDGSIVEWDAYGEVNETYTWISKRHVLPAPVNFGAIKVECKEAISEEEAQAIEDENALISAENAIIFTDDTLLGALGSFELNSVEIGGSYMEPLIESDLFVSVDVYAGGNYVGSANKKNKVVRLPGGFKSDVWEIRASGNARIEQIILATTPRELNGVA